MSLLASSQIGTVTLPDLVLGAAARWGEREALTFPADGVSLTFGELASRVEVVAAWLAAEHEVRRGDHVALLLPNGADFPVTWLALARLGAIAVPINVNVETADLRAALDGTLPRLIVTRETYRELLDDVECPVCVVTELPSGTVTSAPVPSVDVRPEDAVNVQFTSGSTGRSKGCVLSQAYWVEIARTMTTHGPRLNGDDTLLTAQPFSYMDPMWNVACALATGARLVVADRFHPRSFWSMVREYRVTYFYCLGVMPAMLLTTPVDPDERDHAVRYISCSAIPAGRHRDLEERFGAPWFELYGSTETGIDIMVPHEAHDSALDDGAIGSLVPGKEARVVALDDGSPVARGERGLLLLRGVHSCDGYLDEEANSEAYRAGWYVTGDIVTHAADGRFHFHGRAKDIIRRSGENISAVQVEQVLESHPAVDLAACLPVEDQIRGEEVKAYVVLNDERELSSVVEHTRSQLAYFKVPRYWQPCDALPLTPSEKVAKPVLRRRGAGGRCLDLREDVWIDGPPPL